MPEDYLQCYGLWMLDRIKPWAPKCGVVEGCNPPEFWSGSFNPPDFDSIFLLATYVIMYRLLLGGGGVVLLKSIQLYSIICIFICIEISKMDIFIA